MDGKDGKAGKEGNTHTWTHFSSRPQQCHEWCDHPQFAVSPERISYLSEVTETD